MEQVETLHESLCKHDALLNATSSKLSNCVSIHYTGNPLSLSQLDRFLNESVAVVKQRSAYHIGSLSGNLVVSVNLRTEASAAPSSSLSKPKSKRGYDDSSDRAKDAVDAARERLQNNKTKAVSEDHLRMAQSIIERMFRDIKGSNGELVFESLGLSVSQAQAMRTNTASFGNGSSNGSATPPSANSFSTRPNLVIACRLSGGIAIPIQTLKRVLSQEGKFLDGMITTKAETLGPEYRLPLSQLGKEAESKGQASMLMFIAVPIPPLKKAVRHREGEPRGDDREGDEGDEASERSAKQARRV